MTNRRSPLRKAFDEARFVALGAILVAVAFNLFSDSGVAWIRQPPGSGDTVSIGDLLGNAGAVPADTVAVLDTGMAGLDTAAPPSDTLPVAPTPTDTTTTAPRADTPAAVSRPPITSAPAELPKEIGTATAREVFDRKAAVWFDARRAEEFARGHIPGAHNVYEPNFQQHIPVILGMGLAKDRLIVTYCDGGLCELSHDLANNLRLLGFTRVVVYTGGTAEWKAGNHPFTKGE